MGASKTNNYCVTWRGVALAMRKCSVGFEHRQSCNSTDSCSLDSETSLAGASGMRYKAAGAAVDAVYSCSGKLTCTRYEYEFNGSVLLGTNHRTVRTMHHKNQSY